MNNTKRCILLPVLALAFAAVGGAQEKPSISVLDFKASGISEAELVVFVDFITSHIVSTNAYRVIDRSQRETILSEINFSLQDCADEACQVQIGRLLSAKQIVIGSLGRIGVQYILNMKLVEVETGEAVRSLSEVYKSIDDLVNDSKRIAYGLVGLEAAGTSGPAPVAAAPAEEKPKQAEESTPVAIEGQDLDELPAPRNNAIGVSGGIRIASSVMPIAYLSYSHKRFGVHAGYIIPLGGAIGVDWVFGDKDAFTFSLGGGIRFGSAGVSLGAKSTVYLRQWSLDLMFYSPWLGGYSPPMVGICLGYNFMF